MKTCAAIWTTLSLLSYPAFAADCRDVEFESTSFTVCQTTQTGERVELFLRDSDGNILGTFDNAAAQAAPRRLLWAMNGGMYHADRRPVGYYVEKGQEIAPLITRDGPGNFGLLPNGVLCVRDGHPSITESRSFATEDIACDFATQSGPMLVIDGALHPRFLPNSDSLNIRNGIGITPNGELVAAISNEPVNFHRFARLFRDALGTPDALFLDGTISRLYAPGLGRHDLGFPMGPILGVVDAGD